MRAHHNTSTSTRADQIPLTAIQSPTRSYDRVSPERPYQAGWKAYGGHRMYVGAFPSMFGDSVLLATDKAHEAAGFETAQECESAMRYAGFMGNGDHLEIAPFSGQMALF